jgi:hypothetical protein
MCSGNLPVNMRKSNSSPPPAISSTSITTDCIAPDFFGYMMSHSTLSSRITFSCRAFSIAFTSATDEPKQTASKEEETNTPPRTNPSGGAPTPSASPRAWLHTRTHARGAGHDRMAPADMGV